MPQLDDKKLKELEKIAKKIYAIRDTILINACSFIGETTFSFNEPKEQVLLKEMTLLVQMHLKNGGNKFTFEDIRDNPTVYVIFQQGSKLPKILLEGLKMEGAEKEKPAVFIAEAQSSTQEAFDIVRRGKSLVGSVKAEATPVGPFFSPAVAVRVEIFDPTPTSSELVEATSNVGIQRHKIILRNAQAAWKLNNISIGSAIKEDPEFIYKYYFPAIKNFLMAFHPGVTLRDIIANEDARKNFYSSTTLTSIFYITMLTCSPEKNHPGDDITDTIAHIIKISDLFLEIAQVINGKLSEIASSTYTIPKLHAKFIREYCYIHSVDIEHIKIIFNRAGVNNEALRAVFIEIDKASQKVSSAIAKVPVQVPEITENFDCLSQLVTVQVHHCQHPVDQNSFRAMVSRSVNVDVSPPPAAHLAYSPPTAPVAAPVTRPFNPFTDTIGRGVTWSMIQRRERDGLCSIREEEKDISPEKCTSPTKLSR